ncbi:unnamed protein product [Lactuca saligna]|uniref:Uncharacterized protein n=1 Tax=Lactuca saligna TaxID=75948 RepID=A0AA36EJI3_LACSI|nr:unnamed protein product [Lactuca saligna]
MQVVIVPTPTQPEMNEKAEAEADPQKQIIAVLPLRIIDPDSYFDGEIPKEEVPQGTNSDIESELISSILKRGSLVYQGELMTLKLEALLFCCCEWMQIQGIIDKLVGIPAQEVKLAIQELLSNVKKLNLLPATCPSRSSSLGRIGTPRQSKNTKFLLAYCIKYISNKLTVGVEPVGYMFILEPKHGIFYIDS